MASYVDVINVDSDDDDVAGRIKKEKKTSSFKALVKQEGVPTTVFALRKSELQAYGRKYGWTEIKVKTLPSMEVVSFRRRPIVLHFWLMKGTVASFLEHPEHGKTEMFRRKGDVFCAVLLLLSNSFWQANPPSLSCFIK
jgi:hypothetical protein